jgi:hypothetical protein
MGLVEELREELEEYGATIRQWVMGPPLHWRALPPPEQRRIAARAGDIDQLNKSLKVRLPGGKGVTFAGGHYF